MRLFFILMLCLASHIGSSQSHAEIELENIVPNPSFEKYSATPIGWFYKGKHFTNLMKFWSSPTAASPDVFGPKIRVPVHWADKGFGQLTPHSGESMIGLTLYGCDNGKPHCREYVQIQLKEPLVIGQKYYFECWTSKLPRSLEINNLGAYFSKEKIHKKTDEILRFKPEIRAKKLVSVPDDNWVKVAGYFTADAESNYMMVGNFFIDRETASKEVSAESLPYAYYYIDDILLRKEEPIINVPIKENDIRKIPLAAGKKIQLQNIYFDTDKFELLPRSFAEMKKLLNIMHENPKMIVEIIGHTDNVGKKNYNLYLSRKRAKAVVTFLNENGISKYRTRYKGIGSQEPIADNETEKGRKTNRRVEVLIIKK